ncbi:MAG: META domain-containing protein [Thiofilum sp.]|uniref:META domain-containing protein n=1 Tax=Thiofilum sp. TaxID=2212733 RepID=UPI0025D0218A|nr:META domain-containing protein [Thiofilum sp.]MBK8453981.1 META domain-containing protein [Thiofilum sp.]
MHPSAPEQPSRRSFLWLPLAMVGSSLLAKAGLAETTAPAPLAPVAPVAPALPSGACPLNSGGPSLLNTKWVLQSIYGNSVPAKLKITMKVNDSSLEGFTGCNRYNAAFRRVGYTGFRMTSIDKHQKACPVLPTHPGGPTINVGNWEGNYLRTIRRAGSVQQDDNGRVLRFFNRSGEMSVVFRRTYDAA